jgi:hypothetical protein
MTYKQIAETFNILASKKPDGFVMDYALIESLQV